MEITKVTYRRHEIDNRVWVTVTAQGKETVFADYQFETTPANIIYKVLINKDMKLAVQNMLNNHFYTAEICKLFVTGSEKLVYEY